MEERSTGTYIITVLFENISFQLFVFYNGNQPHMWRWTGFNMGLDLIVTFDNFGITLKRSLNTSGNVEHEALLSNHKKRHLYYRVSVVSLNGLKQAVYQASSGIKAVTLNKNQTHEMLKVDKRKANQK